MNYLKIYLIISSIQTLICLFLYLKSGIKDISAILFCLIPFISSFMIALIGSYTKQKHPKITKIIANILNILIFISYSFIILFIIGLQASFDELDKDYKKLSDYPKALNSYSFDKVKHFPKQIPENAKNIEMYRSPSSFTGDSDFHLKFDIDEDYIEQVKQQYQEKISIQHSDYTKQRASIVLSSFIHQDTQDWDIITINDSSCYSGIAAKNPTIIYMLYCD